MPKQLDEPLVSLLFYFIVNLLLNGLVPNTALCPQIRENNRQKYIKGALVHNNKNT